MGQELADAGAVLTLILCAPHATGDDGTPPVPDVANPTPAHARSSSELPAALAALVEEHALKPFQVQVRSHSAPPQPLLSPTSPPGSITRPAGCSEAQPGRA
jgi:hypothetical protein